MAVLLREVDKFQFNEEVIYMKKSISRIIGVIMLIVAIVFIMFALNHPEKSFPWNNTITWLLYGVYFLVAVVLLIAPKIKKWEIPVWWSDKFQFVAQKDSFMQWVLFYFHFSPMLFFIPFDSYWNLCYSYFVIDFCAFRSG